MTDQEKWEKVINGLRCCAIDGGCAACPYDSFKDCPGSYPTPETLMKDALALLEEQEPITPHMVDWNIYECPKCKTRVDKTYNFCKCCGRPVKWDG